LVLGVAVLAAGRPESAADAVTLRGGTTVLGQVVEPSARGTINVLVRRAWAEAHVPDLARRWEGAETPVRARAEDQRRARLAAWRQERAGHAGADDRILAWLNRELDRQRADQGQAAPLLSVALPAGQVQSVARRPKAVARLLRLGWLSGFKDPEGMSVDALADALEGRGFDPASSAPVSVDRLLPTPVESDAQWLARRAATEVTYDEGVRFIRVQQMVLPEPVPGQPLDLKSALSALPDLTKLLAGDAEDALPQRLRGVGARGRVGAVVTRQQVSPDLDNVSVEMVLWVRGPGERWGPFGSRVVTVRSGDVKDDEGKALADDPQVQAAFTLIESLGLGQVPGDVRRKSLNIGAATRKALAQARTAFQDDVARLTLPIDAEPQPAANPKDAR
jgi:hypothetical protein